MRALKGDPLSCARCCLSLHLFSVRPFRTKATRPCGCTVTLFSGLPVCRLNFFHACSDVFFLFHLLNSQSPLLVLTVELSSRPEVGAADQQWLIGAQHRERRSAGRNNALAQENCELKSWGKCINEAHRTHLLKIQQKKKTHVISHLCFESGMFKP